MADCGRRRISGRRTSSSRPSDTPSTPATIMGKSTKERKPKKPKERWLLTRKTWRYMADAGRKLIPDGALNRPEDVPKIEAYFQEVCQKEPRFLLWRKSSYPGALAFRSHRRQRNRKGGSCRTKSNSADECDELSRKKELILAQHTSGGRFDIKKMKQEFFNRPVQSTPYPSPFTKKSEGGMSSTPLPITCEEDEENQQLVDMLADYLSIQEKKEKSQKVDGKSEMERKRDTFDYDTLVQKLQQHIDLIYGSRTPEPSTSTQVSPSYSSFPSSASQIIPSRGRVNIEFEGDHIQKSLLETISRYYSRSPNRERVVSDILTDRKLLEKLYFDLRKTKGFRSTRTGTSGFNVSSSTTPWRSSLKHYERETGANDDVTTTQQQLNNPNRNSMISNVSIASSTSRPLQEDLPRSPPPLIAIHSESMEIHYRDGGIQTDPLSEELLVEIEHEYKKYLNANKDDDIKSPPRPATPRRKSSLDNDDVSQSVSDTIKRYLRMARKKSVDSDKVDRFKRVNYDKNLRFIKAKGETTKPGDDDGLNKGCQTNDDWITIYRDLKFDEFSDPRYEYDFSDSRVTSSRSSLDGVLDEDLLTVNPNPSPSQTPKSPQSSVPSSPSGLIASGQSFLSHLLHGKQHHAADKQNQHQNANNSSTHSSHPVTAGAAVAMQKSKSSSSVMHHGSRLVAKKIWRSRSKSQTRATQNATLMWTPQGQCTWTNVAGRQVTLTDTSLLQLSEVERRVLQKVALAKLQAMNLGATVRIPTETVTVSAATKPKRKAYLLKRKALTTSFFDNTRMKDVDKEKGNSVSGLVFGIPLNQCIENDRIARLARAGSPFRSRSDDETPDLRRHGSRTSFSSLIDTTGRGEEQGSCESLMSRERIGASVPGLLDALSSSTSDLGGMVTPSADDEPSVPNMVNACLRYLESHGLHTLGIFRVSSSKKRVRQLREDFDSGKETMIGEDQCPHDVATLLKEFLRDLPDPLLCRELYHAFVHTQKIRIRKMQFEAIQHLVQLLPATNRDTLFVLLNFLSTVARYSIDQKDSTGEWIPGNKMDSNNLATVFAPNILHCVKAGVPVKEAGPERAEERTDVINVIRSMIDHNRQLFQISGELLDEVYTILMETNPEALNQLLDKKESTMIGDEILDDLETENLIPRNPNVPRMLDDPTIGADSDGSGRHTPKKVWSREEFLHGTAGMGGPNLVMKIRHKEKDRGHDRFSKRRWRDDSISRQQISIEDNNNASAYELIKSRSSSMDSGTVAGDHLRIKEEQRYSASSKNVINDSRRQSTPSFLDDTNIITASLKIPLQPSNSSSHCINLDEYNDIPYIEDSSGYTVITSDGKQQMPIGILRSGGPVVPPRRRQRSASGSDSSQASVGQQQGRPVTASLNLVQTGYDSAVGSSATFSSPPRNTPSSIGSSIVGDGLLSSPPSWASTPPTSPDSTNTTVNYIPDDSARQTTIYSRMTVPIKQSTMKTKTTSTSGSSAVLQKVTFTETSQKSKQIETRAYKRETSMTYRREISNSSSDMPIKSASTTTVPLTTREITKEKEQKFSPSISSIGGAVLRSRTADFERMLKGSSNVPAVETTPSALPVTVAKTKDISTSTNSDKKKYVKRRYTDSRHNTRHIPDSNALESGETDINSVKSNSSVQVSNSRSSVIDQSSSQTQLPIYKRTELIASVPKEKRSFF